MDRVFSPWSLGAVVWARGDIRHHVEMYRRGCLLHAGHEAEKGAGEKPDTSYRSTLPRDGPEGPPRGDQAFTM